MRLKKTRYIMIWRLIELIVSAAGGLFGFVYNPYLFFNDKGLSPSSRSPVHLASS
jgi:hypothetical protein